MALKPLPYTDLTLFNRDLSFFLKTWCTRTQLCVNLNVRLAVVV